MFQPLSNPKRKTIPSRLSDIGGNSCFASTHPRARSKNLSLDFATGICVEGNDQCTGASFASTRITAKPQFAALRQVQPLSIPLPLPGAECHRAQLTESPSWLTAAFWFQEDSEIGLLNGFRRGEISLYDIDGRLRKRVEHGITLEAVVRYRDRLLVKGPNNVFFFLNDNLGLVKRIDLPPNWGSLYPGWIINEDEIVAYGSVPVKRGDHATKESQERGFHLGFIGVNISSGKARLIYPFESNEFYRVNQQYAATARGDAYFLAVDGKEARLFRAPAKGVATLLDKSMPEGYSSVQQPQAFNQGGTARQIFEELETLRMPVGLYGHNDFLFLLTRDPEDCTPWSLHKIDPRSNQVLDSVSLPSIARHVALVPGTEHWLIVEKGAVEEAGNQKIKAVKTVPSAWLEEPSNSPLKRSSRLNRCAEGE